jgi:hypothetical protein
LTLVEGHAGKPDFRIQGGHVPIPGTAPGTATQQNQAITYIPGLRHGSLFRERAKLAEPDSPAFQVIFDQAQVISGCVLNDIQQIHARS